MVIFLLIKMHFHAAGIMISIIRDFFFFNCALAMSQRLLLYAALKAALVIL